MVVVTGAGRQAGEQQRLRLQITSQARKNLQEMTRPIGIANLFVVSLLIIAPALITVISSINR